MWNFNQEINVTFGRVAKYPSEKVHFKFKYELNHGRIRTIGRQIRINVKHFISNLQSTCTKNSLL